MAYRLQQFRSSDAEWDEWLRLAVHDFQHRSGYHRVAEAAGEGSARMLVYGDHERFIAWPYLLRQIPGCDYADITSVYGYPGPVARNAEKNDPFLKEAWSVLRQAWLENRVVSVFTRFHPLLQNQYLLGESDGSILPIGYTVSVDADIDSELRRANYKRTYRQQVKRAREVGVTTELDLEWKYLEDFERIYWSTMDRNEAPSYYHFTHEYFLILKSELGAAGMLAVNLLDEKVICASLNILCGGILNVHLAGTADDYLSLSPFKMMVDDLCEFGRDRGIRSVHLGGGRGGREDTLFRFKSGFSTNRHAFHIGRWVLNHDVYEELSSGVSSEFFPTYRSPKPSHKNVAVLASVSSES